MHSRKERDSARLNPAADDYRPDIYSRDVYSIKEPADIVRPAAKDRRKREANVLTYAGYIVVIAYALLQEPVANFPGEDRGTFSFVIGDFVDHRGCRHPRLTTTDRSWFDRAGLVIPAKE